MEESKYTKSDIEHAEMTGRIIQSLSAFTESQKATLEKVDGMEKKIDDISKDMVTRQELDKRLESYVRQETFEPIKRGFYMGLAGVTAVVITLITGIVMIIKYASQ